MKSFNEFLAEKDALLDEGPLGFVGGLADKAIGYGGKAVLGGANLAARTAGGALSGIGNALTWAGTKDLNAAAPSPLAADVYTLQNLQDKMQSPEGQQYIGKVIQLLAQKAGAKPGVQPTVSATGQIPAKVAAIHQQQQRRTA